MTLLHTRSELAGEVNSATAERLPILLHEHPEPARFLTVLARRWWLFLPLAFLAVGISVLSFFELPHTYAASSTNVLLSPQSHDLANPYLAFDSSLSVTAQIVANAMSDDQTAQELKARGLSVHFHVSVPPDAAGPLISINVQDRQPAVALTTMRALQEMLPTRLADIQRGAGAPTASWITIARVTEDATAVGLVKNRLREAAAVAIGGLLVAVSVPFVVEAIRRRSRRSSAHLGRSERPIP